MFPIVPVIMAGGSGTRLWPVSRTTHPKQFLNLGFNDTLLQQAVSRLHGLTDFPPIIITNEDHRFLVAEQLRQLNEEALILLEPVGRNTAPAIALAAHLAEQSVSSNSDVVSPILLILAADHVIPNQVAFHNAVNNLTAVVSDGLFGTLGIVPTEAASGYGYIKADKSGDSTEDVIQFVEKPSVEIATKYLSESQSSDFAHQWLWNSGMFLVRSDSYLKELQVYRPDIASICAEAMSHIKSDHISGQGVCKSDFIRVDGDIFSKCPDESIDYAVMEPLSKQQGKIKVSALDAGWSDVGSWSALWEILDKDEQGNAILWKRDDGNASCEKPIIINEATNNCLIFAEDKTIATLGIDDLIVVDTKDALLVSHKSKAQDVKNIVAQLKQEKGELHKLHREVYRPWGKYDSVDWGERYQVKRITVNPGAKLSVQMHHHRAEHWIVVSGTAQVTNGDNTFLVTENESTYIPIGQIHCLHNPGKVPLEMIEVQSGSYLGEDDIVRFEDQYGRA